MSSNIRYHILDWYRAFIIINMIAYHFLWDLCYIYNMDIGWLNEGTGIAWERFICISFIALSGFCWQMSRHHLKNGIIIFICGLLITFATMIVMPESVIKYGVLTFIGSAVLLMILMDKLLRHIPSVVGALVSLILFISLYNINNGSILMGVIKLPEIKKGSPLMNFLGFTESSFFSTDYFPILPWIFVFILGYFVYSYIK